MGNLHSVDLNRAGRQNDTVYLKDGNDERGEADTGPLFNLVYNNRTQTPAPEYVIDNQTVIDAGMPDAANTLVSDIRARECDLFEAVDVIGDHPWVRSE